MINLNILITGAWQEAKENINELKKIGHNILFLQNEKDQIPCDYKWIEAVIGNGLFLYHPIEKFINLKYIQLTSAGFDRVDMNYINSHKIVIYNARNVYSIPIAEYVISSVLDFYKKKFDFYIKQKKHIWEKERNLYELYRKTVGIIGCGNIGNECAKRFSAFGCEIIGFDLNHRNDNLYDEFYQINQLDSFLPKIDILLLTVPLTKDTYHLINKEIFELMKNSALLVNVARGAIVDLNALEIALDKKLIRGAILDVFEKEPLDEDSTLWENENIIITPHNSFVGEGNASRLNSVIMENIIKIEQ